MKTYLAVYWRANPQLKNGGYETTREVEARTPAQAMRRAREIADACRYGSMELQRVLTKAEYEA